MVKMKDLT
jgi:hypothetical protein